MATPAIAVKATPPRRVSLTAPLQHPLYRWLWIASLCSNFGSWIQSVGAAWLMTAIAPSADMVALVQAATALPILLLSLAAGAAADIWSRRRILLIGQFWMLTMSASLALLTYLGLTTPWLLLLFTFAIGLGTALNGPAWQASVGELVKVEELPSAIALNSISFNLARSVGPAIGGILVAASGAEAAFLLNAVSYTAMIVTLLRWKQRARRGMLPREHLGNAIANGLRYAVHAPEIRRVLVRAFAYGACGGAAWALMPLVARQSLGGGPLTYGLMLGAIGIGALAGALLLNRARARLGPERLVTVATLAFGATTLTMAELPFMAPVFVMLVLGGAAWIAAMSSFNIAVQVFAAGWVKGRALAVYQMTLFGGLAGGSWVFGRLAVTTSVSHALLAAGVLMLASLALGHRFPLSPSEDAAVAPLGPVAEPELAEPVDPEAGPVMIQVEYRIQPEQADAFVEAMWAVRDMRLRDGAHHWHLHRDAADAARWVEVYSASTWAEHLRQRQRATLGDRAVLEHARSFNQGTPGKVSRLVEQHHPGRHALLHDIRRDAGTG